MKNLRFILFSVFLLSNLFSLGQTRDTIINDKPYIIHTVQPRETLYGISRIYNAELNDLVIHNPKVIQGLHIGFQLIVPQQLKRQNSLIGLQSEMNDSFVFEGDKTVVNDSLNIEEFSDTSTVNMFNDGPIIKMALLLPFYLDENDTLALVDNSIYSKSKIALDYYFGLQLALDTLEKLGYNIHLKVYDIPTDSVLDTLLNTQVLNDRDVIIGPLYNRQFNELVDFYKYEKRKKLISPLSYKQVSGNYTNSYQVVPIPQIQVNALTNYISDIYDDQRLVVIGQESERKLINFTKRKLDVLSYNNAQYVIFEDDQMPTKEDVKQFFVAEENIVFVPSNDRAFVSRMLPVLGSLRDTSFIVAGLDSWNRFENLDMDDLVKLNVHLPSVFLQKNDSMHADFVINFHEKFRSYPSKYSYAAYKQTLGVVSKEFQHLFRFKRYNINTGMINHKFNLLYFDDYKKTIIK